MKQNNAYLDLLDEKVVVFDGAMGTNLDKLNLSPRDYGGQQFAGCNDHLNLTRPDAVTSVHNAFLDVGVDVIETNTFRSNRFTLREFGLENQVLNINLAGAKNARRCADAFTRGNHPRLVAGSIGPTGKLLTISDRSIRTPDFDEIRDVFCEQSAALLKGGVDLILLETMQDILEIKAAILGVHDAFHQTGIKVPVQAQVTVDANGHMLVGTDIGAASAILTGMQIDVFGINCSTGPKEMRASLEVLKRECPLPVSCLPNAGTPENRDGKAVYTLSPSDFSMLMVEYVEAYGVSSVGGCCGTTPAHLKELVHRLGKVFVQKRPKKTEPKLASTFSSINLRQKPAPLIIGERLNAQGSRRFKEILLKGDFDSVASIAEEQIRFGAHALDISTALTENPDESRLMYEVIRRLAVSTNAALVIDTTDPFVLETALKTAPGRCLINSINLENSDEKARRVLALAKDFNAAVIALTIDENGMAKTALEKLAIAKRLHQLAVEDFSLNPCDLVIDPLTFTLASGSPETVNAGKETLEAIRLIHTKLPGTLTCLGISNISYGLSRAARAVVNSVFLYHSIQNGLDTAILNPTHIRAYPEIPDDERNLAEDLIFNSRPDALERLVAHFSGKEQLEVQTPDTAKYYPLGERIRRHILYRVKQGLEADLDEYIQTHMELGEKGAALDALNKLLLPAMKEVGELFATGELILPFVLGSAEVMQVATNHLEPYIAQDKSAQKGKIVLATVYGDVHDIGKNLVRTILSSNGYEVIDLGKQVPVERIITTAVEENADAIGLSALLVSTSQQMLHVIESLKDQNLRFPVLIGGAAVNKDFARRIAISGGSQPYAGGVHYCRDAFDALKILETYQSGSKFLPDKANSKIIVSAKPASAIPKSVSIPPQDIPHPPFWGAHILEDIPLEDLFDNLNVPALFRISWGVKNASGEKWESYKHTLGEKLAEFRRRLKQENWLGPAATYGFFPCDVQDDDLLVLQDSDPRIEAVCFHLPRQQHGAQRSLADYFLPAGLKNKDLAIFQIVTMGQRATEYIQMLQEEKGLSEAYFAHGLAVGLTEAAAKWLHARIRKELGIPKKNGKRYSWGYPQLPDLSQHEKLFQLLPARQIGITLTSAYQFVPEYTTAALVLHHTQAEYFSIEPNKRRKA